MDAQPCIFAPSVGAYHDGELPPARREQFERHLHDCGACAKDLAALRVISRRLIDAPLPAAPAGLVERLRRDAPTGRRRREERAVLRIAEVLTAAAAAVLIAGTVGLLRPARTPPPSSARIPAAAWEHAAVTPDWDDASVDPPGVRPDPTRLVAWTADDFEP